MYSNDDCFLWRNFTKCGSHFTRLSFANDPIFKFYWQFLPCGIPEMDCPKMVSVRHCCEFFATSGSSKVSKWTVRVLGMYITFQPTKSWWTIWEIIVFTKRIWFIQTKRHNNIFGRPFNKLSWMNRLGSKWQRGHSFWKIWIIVPGIQDARATSNSWNLFKQGCGRSQPILIRQRNKHRLKACYNRSELN